ncbi:MAG TPA: 50S ribosomal protein L5 [Acidobacteriota bacterium]|jgi:large subunit ribosomal protein L5|nr:50S ribosomal protein L5 [Acidobacteriota bacterium]HJO29735.1 50S ribosomal protein L5 [Acidobacteriota bacterium]|tara:strand:- start:2482 stop:3036 length:555 start_codon:yes stop_codon:yes gene_type:complete
MVARLKERYRDDLQGQLQEELGLSNPMAVPKLLKIVVNVGVGRATQDIKELDRAVDELTAITGQKPSIRRARKSVASFRLREGMPIGAKVTLRGERMFEFLDRLISIVLPRVRDFRGVSRDAFDGRGNYTIGLKDQLIFPEVDYTQVDRVRGMNVTICTTAESDEPARALLRSFGIPFQQQQQG